MRLRISTTLRWPLVRQIPMDFKERGIEVVCNQAVDECDAWVVYQGLHRPESCKVPPDRVFFFGYEPPGLHAYQERFLQQFAKVVSCHPTIIHPGLVLRHQAQPWLAGVVRTKEANEHAGYGSNFDHAAFGAMAPPVKTRRLSAVCSRKVMIPGHQERLDFLAALQKILGDDLEVFGYGFEPIEDKWDALAPYHYHLVLENSCVPHYWTEKVADAYLAGCLPLVWGCPNLGEYFPEESFVLLDPSDPERSIHRVVEALKRAPSALQLAAVAEARRRVLEEYNLFAEVLQMVDETPAGPKKQVKLKDERLFLPGAWWRPVVRAATDRLRFKTFL